MGHYHSKNLNRSYYDTHSHYDHSASDIRPDDSLSQSRRMYRSKSPGPGNNPENASRGHHYDLVTSEVYVRKAKEDTSYEKAGEQKPSGLLDEEMLYRRNAKETNLALQFVEDFHYIKNEMQNTTLINDGSRLGLNAPLVGEYFPLSRSRSGGRMGYSDPMEDFAGVFKGAQERYEKVAKRIRVDELGRNPRLKGDPNRLKLELLNLSEIRKSQSQPQRSYQRNPMTEGQIYIENYRQEEPMQVSRQGYPMEYNGMNMNSNMNMNMSKQASNMQISMDNRIRSQVSEKESKNISRTSPSPSEQENISKAANMEKSAKQSQKKDPLKSSKQTSAASPMNSSTNLAISKIKSSQATRNEGKASVSPREQTRNKAAQPQTSRQKSPSPNTIKVSLNSRNDNKSQSPFRQGGSSRIEYKPFWKEAVVRPSPGRSPKKDERIPFKHEKDHINTSLEQLSKSLKSSKQGFMPAQKPQYQQRQQEKSPVSREYVPEPVEVKKPYPMTSAAEVKPYSAPQYEKEIKYKTKEPEYVEENSNSMNNARQEADLSLGSFGEGRNSGIEVYGSDPEDVEPIETSIDLSSYLLNNPKGLNLASVQSQGQGKSPFQGQGQGQGQVQGQGYGQIQSQKQNLDMRRYEQEKQVSEMKRYEQERQMQKNDMGLQRPYVSERVETKKGEYGGYGNNGQGFPKNELMTSMKQHLNYQRPEHNEDDFDDQEFIDGIRAKVQGLSEKMESSLSDRPKDQSRDEDSRHDPYKNYNQKYEGNQMGKMKSQYERSNFEDSLRPEAYKKNQGNEMQPPMGDWGGNLKVASSKRLTSRVTDS